MKIFIAFYALVAVLGAFVAAYDEPDYGGGGGDGGGYGGGGGGGGGGSRIKSFESKEELEKILAEEDTSPLVVGYFDESTNSADKDIFEELSNADGYDYRFAMTTTKSALEELKFDGCAVVVYKPPKFLNAKLEKPKARYVQVT